MCRDCDAGKKNSGSPLTEQANRPDLCRSLTQTARRPTGLHWSAGVLALLRIRSG